MPTPAIHQLGNSFDDRNVCLNVALGMISFLRRFKPVLREYGSPRPTPEETTEPGSSSDDDAFLHATLGLISFSATMMGHLERPRRAASGFRANRPDEARARVDTSVVLRELLR